MYLKKLELVGFKSFFNKTTLHFEPGITAIVGPNGTGKSNIFDAIRWVLGEQSVKSLRGLAMQDVIFNGTDLKEPLSMAEVSLTFDNHRRFFPVDHHEVAITRRVFRSGESEYLLNKTLVRLKDILDLFMGTGIGAESYSLVQQGQIDLILSSRPEDRRLVFDEASGITKYKVQKKEALRKLEETEQNLLRVNDIITEVKRQIGSLERQANKARRYKEVFEELKSKELNLAILEKNEMLAQKNAVTNQFVQLEIEDVKLLNLIAEQESKINHYQAESKTLDEQVMDNKNQIVNLDNQISRNKERINFNQERILELEKNKKYLQEQIEQTKNRLILDEEKLNNFKLEQAEIKKNIENKSLLLKDKEDQLSRLSSAIKVSLENIAQSKRSVLDLVTKIATLKNDLADLKSKEQIHLARKKRLRIERAKVNEEKSANLDNLSNLKQELDTLQKNFADLENKLSNLKKESEDNKLSFNNTNLEIADLEKQILALQSQKEFIDELKTKYEDIGEAMNAIIYLDKMPSERVNGLLIKVKDYLSLNNQDKVALQGTSFKATGEAKPIDLDLQKIMHKIEEMQKRLDALKNIKLNKETQIEELNKVIASGLDNLRNQEIVLLNKKANYQTISEQFNKIKEEEDIIVLELKEVENELSILEEKLVSLETSLSNLDKEQKKLEDSASSEQNTIALNSKLREETLVIITQTKTELEALTKRIASDEGTLKMLQDTYKQDNETLLNLQKQIADSETKCLSCAAETKDLENKIIAAQNDLQKLDVCLNQTQGLYKEVLKNVNEITQKIALDRKGLDTLKDKLYELQMQNKDIEFKILNIKERILQAYKVDLDSLEGMPEQINKITLLDQIRGLKEKLDSYGAVNLVAIEEYDELKKRYDFLSEQQNDLFSAKESLHEAILKINRTTKKMFLETFEKVRLEFRNYFRLLFNGGEAQLFLIDEQDPLESGIEIICRPPGKKLQNVLLLSGGEKSLAAIALIFAIFKVKPSPFCVLDEIDAALDEANVDRFSRILQDFTQESQFLVITHNKRTIANTDVMYGITMEESGVSRIVSVKFAQGKQVADGRLDTSRVAEPV